MEFHVFFLNPNLPDPVNFVPFGTMRYSPFDINLISITCMLFVYLYFCLFLYKAYSFLFAMIYALSRYIIFLTFKNVIDSRLTRNILKMGRVIKERASNFCITQIVSRETTLDRRGYQPGGTRLFQKFT